MNNSPKPTRERQIQDQDEWIQGAETLRKTGMLILTRKIGESIIIRDDTVVTVLEIRGSEVRLGIAAPREIPVHRQEVYEAIRRGESRES